MGKEVWNKNLSRSPCLTWEPKWLGELIKHDWLHIFMTPYRTTLEKVRQLFQLCDCTFSAWLTRRHLYFSLSGGSVNLWVIIPATILCHVDVIAPLIVVPFFAYSFPWLALFVALMIYQSMNGVMGIANAQRTLTYLRILTEFISQPQYRDVVGM